jgi:predicted RNA-binding protein with EMAP domain
MGYNIEDSFLEKKDEIKEKLDQYSNLLESDDRDFSKDFLDFLKEILSILELSGNSDYSNKNNYIKRQIIEHMVKDEYDDIDLISDNIQSVMKVILLDDLTLKEVNLRDEYKKTNINIKYDVYGGGDDV